MQIKKYLSLFMVLALAFSAVAGGFIVSADAVGETVTYSYMVKTDDDPAAFEGTLYYPADKLEVKSTTVLGVGWSNPNNSGRILFNNTNAETPYDLSDYTALITVTFEVKAAFDGKDISVELAELYSLSSIQAGNIPYFYKNTLDGDRVSSGYIDIDNSSNNVTDPDNIDYTVVYTYSDTPTTSATLTKTVSSPSENATTVADLGMPSIENPYYTYELESASFESGIISASLKANERKYDVTYNNVTTKLGFLETFTAEAEEEKDFLMDGVVVATGTEFSFFVTGDTVITTDVPTGNISDSAAIVRKGLAITDNSSVFGDTYVKMEFLVTVKSGDFARMGVALALSEKSADAVKDAVTSVETGASVHNKISVYNSKVDYPNKSGQYQFIYAPFASTTKLTADKTLYFYSFGVDKQGNVTVSDYTAVNMANVLA